MGSETARYAQKLTDLMAATFSLADLEDLSFKLGVVWEQLPGDTLNRKARSLIFYLWQRERLDELLKELGRERPKKDWPGPPDIEPQGLNAVEAASTAMGWIDTYGDEFVSLLAGRDYLSRGEEKIERVGNDLVLKYGETEDGRVTYDQLLERLSEKELRHIEVLQQSMDNYYSDWESIFPQLALEKDPDKSAQLRQRLKEIVAGMKWGLIAILDFVRQMGLELVDHYREFYNLINNPQLIA